MSVARLVSIALLLSLLSLFPAVSRATPATPEQEAAMATEASRSRIDEIRERTLRAKARLFLLRAALKATHGHARTPEQALANAQKTVQAEQEESLAAAPVGPAEATALMAQKPAPRTPATAAASTLPGRPR